MYVYIYIYIYIYCLIRVCSVQIPDPDATMPDDWNDVIYIYVCDIYVYEKMYILFCFV